jgi:plastocyanin
MSVVRAWSGRVLLAGALVSMGLWSVPTRTAAAAPDVVAPPAAKTVTFLIDGIAFSAATDTVYVGDTVAWVNKDAVDHTATDKKGAWRVVIKAGKTGSLVMKKAGTFDYYCEFHPNMAGQLVVKAAGK